MTLDELPIGAEARVFRIPGGEPVMLRLMEMGLVRGATVEVRKRAPFRGPLELRVEGYLLSIRRAEAARIGVEPTAVRVPRTDEQGAPSPEPA